MEQPTLSPYVLERLRAGTSKVDIIEQLQAVGWSEEEALLAYRDGLIALGAPVPTANTKRVATKRASTVEIVLNFFSFILLGIVASALGVLYFQIINYFFPDPLMSGYAYYRQAITSAVHYAIAALVIAFPLYVAAVRLWFRRYREDEGKEESKLTKWVTYLVLLVASITIVGDLITTLNTFLSGEITARFFLKALTIIVIAGMVFGFYYLERKKVQYGQDISRKTFQVFGWVLAGVILIGIILGFVVAGSPQTERMRTFDEQRASDLSQIAQCVTSYANQFNRLPQSLVDLEKTSTLSYCSSTRDPETGAPYTYQVLTPLVSQGDPSVLEGEFELCATFATASEAGDLYSYDSKWREHGAGEACDTESVAVRLSYPPADTQPTPLPVR